jgi:hypothetical protein
MQMRRAGAESVTTSAALVVTLHPGDSSVRERGMRLEAAELHAQISQHRE